MGEGVEVGAWSVVSEVGGVDEEVVLGGGGGGGGVVVGSEVAEGLAGGV